MVEIIFVGALSQEMQCAAPNKVSRVPRMRSAPGGVSNIGATPRPWGLEDQDFEIKIEQYFQNLKKLILKKSKKQARFKHGARLECFYRVSHKTCYS